MNDFDYDAYQKKRTAQGARHTNRVKPGCILPSDWLTAGQKKKMNGEAITMELNKPMNYRTFKTLSPGMAETYIKNLIDRFGATQTAVAKMFGISQSTLSYNLSRRGLAVKFPAYQHMDEENWERFLSGKEELNPAPETDPEPEQEEPTVKQEEPKQERRQVLTGMTLTFKDCRSWQELANFIGGIPIPDGAVITVTMEGRV